MTNYHRLLQCYFQGNTYLLPNEIICLLQVGVKITSSFLHYLKNQIGIVIHLQMWRPKNHIDIFSTLSQISTPAWESQKVLFSRFFFNFPCWFQFLLSMAFEKLEKSVFPDSHCCFFHLANIHLPPICIQWRKSRHGFSYKLPLLSKACIMISTVLLS